MKKTVLLHIFVDFKTLSQNLGNYGKFLWVNEAADSRNLTIK